VIATPGGRAPAPVVAPEESTPRPTTPPPSASPPPGAAPVDEDDDDEGDDEEDPGDSASSGSPVDLRLTALQTATVGKPTQVALYASGSSKITTATIAIKYDPKVLRVAKVESTGLFDGKLGAKLPYEAREGMLFVSMSRGADLASQPLSGQILNIAFDVIAAGTVTLSVVPQASRMLGPGNSMSEVRFGSPVTVTAR